LKPEPRDTASLTALHFRACHITYMFGVRAVNDLLKLLDMCDLEGNETPGNRMLNRLHKISSLYRLPQLKSSVFNCTAYTLIK
jgi:hypothetical protein